MKVCMEVRNKDISLGFFKCEPNHGSKKMRNQSREPIEACAPRTLKNNHIITDINAGESRAEIS